MSNAKAICIHCRQLVLPLENGQCPFCQKVFVELPGQQKPQEISTRERTGFFRGLGRLFGLLPLWFRVALGVGLIVYLLGVSAAYHYRFHIVNDSGRGVIVIDTWDQVWWRIGDSPNQDWGRFY